MKKNSKYMKRALQSRDPRFARVLGKLGYDRMDMVADETSSEPAKTQEEIYAELKIEYESVLGKRPYYGWDESELRKRIAEAKAEKA